MKDVGLAIMTFLAKIQRQYEQRQAYTRYFHTSVQGKEYVITVWDCLTSFHEKKMPLPVFFFPSAFFGHSIYLPHVELFCSIFNNLLFSVFQFASLHCSDS